MSLACASYPKIPDNWSPHRQPSGDSGQLPTRRFTGVRTGLHRPETADRGPGSVVNHPPPYTRARIISGPFFFPDIPAPRGVPADGLADAILPLGSKTGVSWAFFPPRVVSVSVWLAGSRSPKPPKSTTYAPRFAVNRTRRSSIEPRHHRTLRRPVHRQRVALEPQQAHAPGLLPGIDRLHDVRLQ